MTDEIDTLGEKTSRSTLVNNHQEILDPKNLYHELNLLRIEGYYFCFDPKQSAKSEDISVTELLKTDERITETVISVRPNQRYGKPSIVAYNIHHAVLDKYSDYFIPVPECVHFTQRELATSSGRSSYGGGNKKEYQIAIKQLLNTEIEASFYDKETNEWAIEEIKLYNRARLSGKNNEITECILEINPLIRKSLNNRHFFCLSNTRLKLLAPISKALYKRLFYHFSTIYSHRKTKNFTYNKNYADICNRWLGGLKVHNFKSKIINEQLGVHFKALKASKLIAKVEINKNKDGDGFNVIFYPGKGFFEDYYRFYCSNQLELDFQGASNQHNQVKPFELVNYFYCKLKGVEEIGDDILPDKDIEYARELLEKHPYDTLIKLVDYTLKEASKTNFDIKSFRGIERYKVHFFAAEKKRQENEERKKKAQEAAKAKRIAEQAEQKLKAKYDEYVKSETEKYKSSLSTEELEKIKAKLTEENPIMAGTGFLDMIIDSRLAECAGVPDFKDWKETHK